MKKETALLWLERLCRIGIGAMFIYSAAIKIDDPGVFADAVSRYEFLPEFTIGMFSLTMSMIELLTGAALVFTKWTREAALLVTVMMLMFIVALTQALVRGLEISCGCFGAPQIGGRAEIALALARDVALLVPSVWLMMRRNGWLFSRACAHGAGTGVAAAVAMLCLAASAEIAVSDGPVRPGEWNSNVKAAMAEAEKTHTPMVLVHATPDCTFCARLKKGLEGGAFALWCAERAPIMAYVDDLSPQQPSAAGRTALDFVQSITKEQLPFPHVGVYWPRENGVTNRVAFSGRRGLMGVERQGPHLVAELMAALDNALLDHIASKPSHRKPAALIKDGTRKISCRAEGGSGTVKMKPKSGVIEEGETVKLSAAEGTDSVFVGWYGPDGKAMGRAHSLTVSGCMPQEYVAQFRKASECRPPIAMEPAEHTLTAHVGERFKHTIALREECYPAEFRLTGTLPPGLKMRNAASGTISGHPTATTTNDVEITITGSDPAKTELRKSLRIIVLPSEGVAESK